MSIAKTYTRELREEFDHLAMWLPDTVVSIGDIGELRDHKFERVGSIADFDLEFEESDAPTESTLTYQTTGGVAIQGATSANSDDSLFTLVGGAGGRLKLEFKRENAIYFHVSGLRGREFKSLQLLENEVLRLFDARRWDERRVVVTKVLVAESTTVLIGGERGSHIEFELNADLGRSRIAGAEASAALNIRSAKGVGLEIVSKGGLTPLVRTWGIRKLPFSKPQFRPRSGAAAPDAMCVEVDYEDFVENGRE